MRIDQYHHIHYKHKRRSILGISIIVLLMIYFFKNASFLLRALSTVGFFAFFYIIDHSFDVRFKPKHYAFVIIIALVSFLTSPFYYVYPYYDKIQHFILPIMICSIIFHMVAQLHLHMKWKLVFTFFIVVALLGLFELGEYGLDYFFDLKLQGVYLRDLEGLEKFNLLVDRIDDTMVDLIFGVLGSMMYVLVHVFRMRRELFWD